MVEYKLKTPLKEEDVRKLRVGDVIYITGLIYTARDQAHRRILEYVEKGQKLPVDLNGSVIFHVGPLMRKEDDNWIVVSAGPTTSTRMNLTTPKLLENFKVRIIIGKGGMSREVAEALKRFGAVYCHFTGGAGVLAAKNIRKVEGVEWLDLGMPGHEFDTISIPFQLANMPENLYQEVVKDVTKYLNSVPVLAQTERGFKNPFNGSIVKTEYNVGATGVPHYLNNVLRGTSKSSVSKEEAAKIMAHYAKSFNIIPESEEKALVDSLVNTPQPLESPIASKISDKIDRILSIRTINSIEYGIYRLPDEIDRDMPLDLYQAIPFIAAGMAAAAAPSGPRLLSRGWRRRRRIPGRRPRPPGGSIPALAGSTPGICPGKSSCASPLS